MRRQIEFREQQALIHWRDSRKAMYPQLESLIHIPNRPGSRKDGYFKKIMGVSKGFPDLFLFYPQAREVPYHGLAIEMKSEGGTETLEQRQWQKRLRDAGYMCEFCFDWIQSANMIIDYLNLPEKEKIRA